MEDLGHSWYAVHIVRTRVNQTIRGSISTFVPRQIGGDFLTLTLGSRGIDGI